MLIWMHGQALYQLSNFFKEITKLQTRPNYRNYEYLHSHLDQFHDNLGDYSEEQEEHFDQNFKSME